MNRHGLLALAIFFTATLAPSLTSGFPDGNLGGGVDLSNYRWAWYWPLSFTLDRDSCGSASSSLEVRRRSEGIRRGIESWSAASVPGSNFPLGTITEGPLPIDVNSADSVSTVTVRIMPAPLRFEAGFTYTRHIPGGLTWIEADIILNSQIVVANPALIDSFPADRDSLYDNASVEGVARHEMGHAAGFRPHELSRVATMTWGYSFGQGESARMHGDDRNGLRTYYPASPIPPGGWETDYALSGWKVKPETGRLIPVADPWPDDIEAGNNTVRVEFTAENLGTEAPPASSIGFYLSTDAVIDTTDMRIDGFPPAATSLRDLLGQVDPPMAKT